VAYLSAFLVTANAFRKWAELRAAAGALAVSGFVMAAVGIAHKFSGSSLILWFHVPRFGGSIFGPFTNRNHYAAHMNMTVGLTLGLLVAASVVRLSGLQTWRERLTWLSTRTANRLVLLGFALAVMAGSVWVSLSRGGISSLVIALGAVGVGTVVLGGGRSRARLAAAMALLLAGALLWVGWRPIFERMGTLAQVDPVSDSRMAATRATLAIFARAPLAGDGFGSFQHVFPMFQKPDIQFGRWLHAHNDYAQLLAEGGILGALLAALTAGMLTGSVARRFRRATPQCRAMVTGLAVALVTIALHSLVDYGLHKPANAFMLAAVCGMSVAAVHVRAKRLRSAESSGQEDEEREHRAEKEDGPVAASRA
jgi:O-antigen ligase